LVLSKGQGVIVAKQKDWIKGYKTAEDYFTNAPDDLLQKHYFRIKDFELSLAFNSMLMKYRNPFPLLEANPELYENMGIK
jgi:hypothetical protein